MDSGNDIELVKRSLQGDEQAFETLVQRHMGPLQRLVRYQIPGVDAEDVLQDTLLHAWRDLPNLRDPIGVKSWLLQVARNRCRDFVKKAARRERPTAGPEIELLVNRTAMETSDARRTRIEVRDAMSRLGPADHALLHSHYLEGSTITEMAAHGRLPEGTVKRRLYDARQRLRGVLMEAPAGRKHEMSTHRLGSKTQPFPKQRPPIVIKPSRVKPFELDFRELRWWVIIPALGERLSWADYDPPDWNLTSVYDCRVVREAAIHGLDGVEIDVDYWTPEKGWKPRTNTIWGRLTETSVQWLAFAQYKEDKWTLETFLDEGFEKNFGSETPRRLYDSGRFVETENGGLEMRPGDPAGLGAGMFSVKIGGRSHTCLRVLDIEGGPGEDATLAEVFIGRNGRTVLFRRYNGRLWGHERGRKPWDETFPNQQRLIINGVLFVHWYDCLDDTLCKS